MRKIFTLLFAIVTSTILVFAEKVQIDDLYYNLDEISQTAEVTYEKSGENNYAGLDTVVIPSSVEYNSVVYTVTGIGQEAFYYGSSINSFSIPNSVTTIGNWAFSYCYYLKSIEIPNSVTRIGSGAFKYCANLTSIEIPNSVTSIGSSAFESCTVLTTAVLSDSITSIAGYLFYNCGSLTSVIIPDKVLNIGGFAFWGCWNLPSITIPANVTSIGVYAFYGCQALTSITCKAITPPTCAGDVFYEVNKSIPLYVPANSVDAYKTADEWKDFSNIQPINTEGLSNVSANLGESRKLLRNGQVLIQDADKTYTITGQEIK